MSGRKPDDQLLEDFLAGKGEVSRAYRDGQKQSGKSSAPAQLDDAVLKMAREELDGTARSVRKSMGWQWPVAVAATMVLSFSVLLSIKEDRVASSKALLDVAPVEAPPQSVEPIAVPEAPPPAMKDERAARPEPKPRRTPEAPPTVASDAPKSAAMASGAVAPQAQALKKQMVIQEQDGALDEQKRQENQRQMRQPRADSEALAEQRERGKMEAAEAGGAPSFAAAPAAYDSAESPSAKDWLMRIRKLRGDKKLEEARKELQAFQRSYPEFKLPDDLKTLAPAPAAPPSNEH